MLTFAGSELPSAVLAENGRLYSAPGSIEPLSPGSYSMTSLSDPIIGPAEQIVAEYSTVDGATRMRMRVTASREAPAFLYQLELVGMRPQEFQFFAGEQRGFDLRGPVDYVTILSPGHVTGTLLPGDAPRELPLPQGAPVLIWSETSGHGYVLGLLDYSLGRTTLTLTNPEDGSFQFLATSFPQDEAPNSSARMFVQQVRTRDLGPALSRFRAALDVVAPAPPLPPTFRQQWGSWYVYGAGISEENLREQIDAIAAGYGDLGPWQIVIDAGWYLSGSHPEGAIGEVDPEKFPAGMWALVDYAHQRGIGVALYGSAPWVDTRPSTSSWWVVQQGLVRDHPAWFILVDEDDEGATYVYDLSNPSVRAFLDDLARRYLIDFDADGIELEMVGILGPEGGHFRGDEVSVQTLPPRDLAQTLALYRFTWETATRHKPDVWIESGYAAPPLARRYVHSWRFADDFPAFSHPYPFAGLLEQLTHAVVQDQLLGRRAHLGFIWGAPDKTPIHLQWLAAAVATRRQTILSIDLANADPASARRYREYLTALRPFAANPVYGPGLPPETFATRVGSTTYLGLLNAEDEDRNLTANLIQFGLSPGQTALAFDPETRTSLLATDTIDARVSGESFRLLVLRTEPGVLWADRSWSTTWEANELVVQVEAGGVVYGTFWLYAPELESLTIDGAPLTVDDENVVIAVEIPDGSSHEIRLSLHQSG